MQKYSPIKNHFIQTQSQQQPIASKFQKYVLLTSSLLRDLIENQEDEESSESSFDSSILKNIQLKTYIERVHKQTNFEPESLIIALIYIDRYNLKQPYFVLTWNNIHKLLLTCLLLATKFHDQFYYDNKAFEIGGGVNNVNLFELEIRVFQTLEFNLFVDEQYFFEFLNSLFHAYLAQKQPDDETCHQSEGRTKNFDQQS